MCLLSQKSDYRDIACFAKCSLIVAAALPSLLEHLLDLLGKVLDVFVNDDFLGVAEHLGRLEGAFAVAGFGDHFLELDR